MTELKTACDLLLAHAGNIPDEDLRRSFLENVAAHREIVAAWEMSQNITTNYGDEPNGAGSVTSLG
jgi:hypothetical protein